MKVNPEDSQSYAVVRQHSASEEELRLTSLLQVLLHRFLIGTPAGDYKVVLVHALSTMTGRLLLEMLRAGHMRQI